MGSIATGRRLSHLDMAHYVHTTHILSHSLTHSFSHSLLAFLCILSLLLIFCTGRIFQITKVAPDCKKENFIAVLTMTGEENLAQRSEDYDYFNQITTIISR